MKYKPGDIAYIVGNNKFIHEVKILNSQYGFVTVHLLKENSYIRLRENRLFPSKEAAEDSLPKKDPAQ